MYEPSQGKQIQILEYQKPLQQTKMIQVIKNTSKQIYFSSVYISSIRNKGKINLKQM
ncbi:unnamed protein product [Paramecium octaurelia]|uniref:Uncharacterized protein n=1 Tax=Paramecium octaurelia TaxID=43137 RepID=A0A8S1YDW3_PAROT|nr:unnamed protein product [Paramecium octaurelia]